MGIDSIGNMVLEFIEESENIIERLEIEMSNTKMNKRLCVELKESLNHLLVDYILLNGQSFYQRVEEVHNEFSLKLEEEKPVKTLDVTYITSGRGLAW